MSEWLKEAASKTVDRPKAVRRFESCRFRSCKGLAKVLADPFCIFAHLLHQCRSAPTIQTKEKIFSQVRQKRLHLDNKILSLKIATRSANAMKGHLPYAISLLFTIFAEWNKMKTNKLIYYDKC